MSAAALKRRVCGLALVVFGASPVWAESVPSLQARDLGRGPYSTMSMLVEKTILNVDVAQIDIRFGKKATQKFEKILRGKDYSPALARQLTVVAVRADDAVVQFKFLRDVSLQRWLEGAKGGLEKAEKAGLIDRDLRVSVSRKLPVWYAPLKTRGFKKGDRLLYRMRPESLHTMVLDNHGKTMLDLTNQGTKPSDVVLASYFAPGVEYREPLFRSLGP